MPNLKRKLTYNEISNPRLHQSNHLVIVIMFSEFYCSIIDKNNLECGVKIKISVIVCFFYCILAFYCGKYIIYNLQELLNPIFIFLVA